MNAGTIFPRATYMDYGQRGPETYRTPPRQLWFECVDNNLIGDLAEAWAGISVLSTVCERYSEEKLRWIMYHPTLVGYEIHQYWRIGPSHPSGHSQQIHFDTEYWAEGLLQASVSRGELLNQSNLWFIPSTGPTYYIWLNSLNWTYKRTPARIFLMANYSVRVAMWGDDPNYQPYRTRP